MVIRKAKLTDIDDLREICYVTSKGFDTPRKVRALELMYCDYYVECNSDYVFVAEKDNKTIGYILCAPNYFEYEKLYREKYLGRLRKVSLWRAVTFSISLKIGRKYAKEYPAHLHIDIKPEGQKMGIGTELMRTLFNKLKEDGVKGVHLIVGSGNKNAIKFYNKMGFNEIDRLTGCIVFGKGIDKSDVKE